MKTKMTSAGALLLGLSAAALAFGGRPATSVMVAIAGLAASIAELGAVRGVAAFTLEAMLATSIVVLLIAPRPRSAPPVAIAATAAGLLLVLIGAAT